MAEQAKQPAEKTRMEEFKKLFEVWLEKGKDAHVPQFEAAVAFSDVLLLVEREGQERIRKWCRKLGYNADSILTD